MSINPTTGDITPSTSTPGTYTVTYTIAPTGGCPTITATTSVTINPELAPTITCGTPSTTSVQFNWGAVTGATGYDVSYVVTGNPAVNAGSVGNVTTYDVTGLTPGSVVTITVTPTNPSGGCFKSASFACTASSCTPATANISYATPFLQQQCHAAVSNLNRNRHLYRRRLHRNSRPGHQCHNRGNNPRQQYSRKPYHHLPFNRYRRLSGCNGHYNNNDYPIANGSDKLCQYELLYLKHFPARGELNRNRCLYRREPIVPHRQD